jgi:DNA-binding GntR family transcriptional regulator
MAQTTDDTIRRVNIAADVAERLRHDLLNGGIGPGQRIKMTTLEQRFGVSHIPIREALRQLEAEGFVYTLPQGGTVAAGVDLEDLAGLYDLRRLIEGQVVYRAVEAATPEQLDSLQTALDALEAAAGDVESPLFWQRHREFHWALLEPGANAWIRRVLDQVWLAAERYVRIFVSQTFQGAMREHRALAAAARRGDAEQTQRLLIAHLNRTEDTVRKGFRKGPSAQTDAG